MKSLVANKAPYLVGYVRMALKIGHHVDPLLLHFVKLLHPGGLRRALQKKGARGERGLGLGDHYQLLLAREMWKQINLTGLSERRAAESVARRVYRSASAARNAYYRFTKTNKAADRRMLVIELKRDYLDNRAHWTELASDPLAVDVALTKLPSF